jgi:hypothetical protein
MPFLDTRQESMWVQILNYETNYLPHFMILPLVAIRVTELHTLN